MAFKVTDYSSPDKKHDGDWFGVFKLAEGQATILTFIEVAFSKTAITELD